MPYVKKEYTHICNWCENEFVSNHPATKYCSYACRAEWEKFYFKERDRKEKGTNCIRCKTKIRKSKYAYCFDCVVDLFASDRHSENKLAQKILNHKKYSHKELIKALRDGVALW